MTSASGGSRYVSTTAQLCGTPVAGSSEGGGESPISNFLADERLGRGLCVASAWIGWFRAGLDCRLVKLEIQVHRMRE
jgi:hypothetical protein